MNVGSGLWPCISPLVIILEDNDLIRSQKVVEHQTALSM